MSIVTYVLQPAQLKMLYSLLPAYQFQLILTETTFFF